jgi:hypothetical protein
MTAGCPGCAGGPPPLLASADCAALALVVAEREFADPRYFAVHAVTAAAYRVQHPDTVKPHSVAVGLVVLQGADLDAEALQKRIRWAAPLLRAHPPTLTPPSVRWRRTIDDVVAARDPDEHAAMVRAWAEELWAGWSETHTELARALA